MKLDINENRSWEGPSLYLHITCIYLWQICILCVTIVNLCFVCYNDEFVFCVLQLQIKLKWMTIAAKNRFWPRSQFVMSLKCTLTDWEMFTDSGKISCKNHWIKRDQSCKMLQNYSIVCKKHWIEREGLVRKICLNLDTGRMEGLQLCPNSSGLSC